MDVGRDVEAARAQQPVDLAVNAFSSS